MNIRHQEYCATIVTCKPVVNTRTIQISQIFSLTGNVPEYGIPLTLIFPYKVRIVDSMSLYGKLRVRESPYSGIFYAVSKQVLVQSQ